MYNLLLHFSHYLLLKKLFIETFFHNIGKGQRDLEIKQGAHDKESKSNR